MKTLDLREIPAAERKNHMEVKLPLIEAGEELVVIADQDPSALFREFDTSKLVRSLDVRELESGPSLWRILVQAPKGHGEGGCCGSCGG